MPSSPTSPYTYNRWGLVGNISEAGFLHCRSLQVLSLRGLDALVGGLPKGLGKHCPDLRVLDVSATHLHRPMRVSGRIPKSLGKCKGLRRLVLAGCEALTGDIPKSLGNCRKLQLLNLSRCSGLTGAIPSELGRCAELREMYLTFCSGLVGALPEDITQQCLALQVLGLHGTEAGREQTHVVLYAGIDPDVVPTKRREGRA